MALVNTADLISITEASKRGVSALVREAEAGHEQILLRTNRAVAAVVSMERLEDIERLQADLLDVSLAAARMLTTGPHRHALDDVLATFGYSREQLRDLAE